MQKKENGYLSAVRETAPRWYENQKRPVIFEKTKKNPKKDRLESRKTLRTYGY